ncbi:MAG: PQQ-dependent sugar dehydrogenase, partial [Methanoregula sp.]|nr:PQQ-dependent sugar dehydrogenase [Methanoregula sp.]
MTRSLYGITIILLLAAAAGCMTTPPAGTPGPGGTPSAGPVADDLTNRFSELAAGFRGGSSYTVLAPGSITVGLVKVAGGFTAPMMIAGDGSGRLFVVDQTGTVSVIAANGSVPADPFIDLRDRMAALGPGYDERGLLSIAFHPDYRSNGRVFVFYTAPLRQGGPAGWCCTNRLSEFRVMPENPDRVDMGSEKILVAIDKPQMNHNGGQILFGPGDGYLYLALGD